MSTVPIFRNNAGTKQCACCEDGQWFIRYRRVGRPGWSRWEPAPFNERPLWAWYNGQHARLKRSVNEFGEPD